MTQDDAAKSAPTIGSLPAGIPVVQVRPGLWVVVDQTPADETYEDYVKRVWFGRSEVFQTPMLRLTQDERAAIDVAIKSMCGLEEMTSSWSEREAAAVKCLRNLMGRTS